MNGTSRFEDDGNRLEDNIPKTPQLVCFPIAGYSEYQRKQNQGETHDLVNQKNVGFNLLPSARESMNQGSRILL